MNHFVQPDQHPGQLRHRAEMLRRMAIRLDSIGAAALLAWAGPETWDSPRAELCRELLRCNLEQITHAQQHLRVSARALDERAALHEARSVQAR